MGWKRVKEHYGIVHIVQLDRDTLLIGSPYISDIITVSPAGKILKGYASAIGELCRYQREIEACPRTFAALLAEEDSFSQSVPVFTYEGADIIELRCEEPGWPNVTHDGRLMYENTYFATHEQAVAAATRNAESRVELFVSAVADAEKRLLELKDQLGQAGSDLEALRVHRPEE